MTTKQWVIDWMDSAIDAGWIVTKNEVDSLGTQYAVLQKPNSNARAAVWYHGVITFIKGDRLYKKFDSRNHGDLDEIVL